MQALRSCLQPGSADVQILQQAFKGMGEILVRYRQSWRGLHAQPDTCVSW